MDPLVVLFGLGVGILVGTTGMGGGSLMTPLLILVFGVKPVMAIGTDLAYAAITKTFGAWRHHALRNVNHALVRWLAIGSVPSSVLGVFTLDRLRDRLGDDVDVLVQDALGFALVLVGIAFVAKTCIRYRPVERELGGRLSLGQKLVAASIGLVFGFALGFTSVGSGTFFGMAMMLAFPLRPQRLVGTDVFHAAILVFAAASAQTVAGNVQFGTVGWILVGSLPGIFLGAQFTGRAPERALRLALGVTLAVAGIALLTSG